MYVANHMARPLLRGGRLQPPVIHRLEYLCDLASVCVCEGGFYTLIASKAIVTESKAKTQVRGK